MTHNDELEKLREENAALRRAIGVICEYATDPFFEELGWIAHHAFDTPPFDECRECGAKATCDPVSHVPSDPIVHDAGCPIADVEKALRDLPLDERGSQFAH